MTALPSSRKFSNKYSRSTILDVLNHANYKGFLPNLQKLDEILTGGAQSFVQSCPELKGSIGEGPNQTNFSDQSSVRTLGIERKPRKPTPSKWHSTQNTRRGRRKGKQTALKQRGGLRSRTNSNDAILAIKRCNACLHKRICLPSKSKFCQNSVHFARKLKKFRIFQHFRKY